MKKIIFSSLLLCGFFVCSCARTVESPSRGSDPLDKKEFVLVNMFDGYGIDIGFDNGRIYGFAGVNRYMGSYAVSGGSIKLGHTGTTMMAGPEDKMKAETEYLKLLGEASSFTFDGSVLKLGKLEFRLK